MEASSLRPKGRMLVLIRGLPGSGKSTLARELARKHSFALVYSADDFFTDKGEYRFEPSKLPEAHNACKEAVRRALSPANSGNVFVANTFSCRWEMEPYLRLGQEAGALIVVHDCFDRGLTNEQLAMENIHGVPVHTIRQMRARWEHDWRAGNPCPPWERVKRVR